MPTEPDRPIEATLRTYARQRRQELGDALELPTSTRQRLLAEVNRFHAAQGKAAHNPRAWFRAFWPRLAWAGAACAALAFLAIRFFGPQPAESTLVRIDAEAPEARELRQAPPLAAPMLDAAPVTVPVEQPPSLAAARTSEEAWPVPKAMAVAPAKPDVAAPAARRSEGPPPDRLSPAPAAAPILRSDTSAAPATESDATERADSTGEHGVRFHRLDPYRRNLNAPPAVEVLREFTVFQSDARLRILDADGSVYTGELILEEVEAAGRQPTVAAFSPEPATPRGFGATRGQAPEHSAPSRPPPPRLEEPETLRMGARFIVRGVNRTTGLPVTFTGSISTAAERVRSADTSLETPFALDLRAREPDAAVTRSATAAPTAARRVAIQGQVQVGEDIRLNISAAPR